MDPSNNISFTVADQDYDIDDLIYFGRLTPEQKLNYLEKLVLALDQITPPQAKEYWLKLKESGFDKK